MPTDPDKGWQLPTVVNPSEYWCFQIDIPKDLAYLRAFRGAIGEMAYYWNWQQDGGDTASQVVQVWMEQLRLAEEQFNNSEGVCSVDCDDILDCIETTESIQNAIALYSSQGGANANTPEDASILATQIIDNQLGCNKDNIYGMTVQLVTFIDEINKDIFEVLSASANAMARLGDLIEAIPIVGELPLDDAFQFAEKVNDDIQGAYLAASTVALRAEVACDLMCLADANGCILSMAQARDYFLDKLGISLDLSNPLTFFNDLIANNLAGTIAFYAMYALYFQVMIYGTNILGVYADRFANMVKAMFNDPNPDWSTECDDCPDIWMFDSDFNNSQSIFQPTLDSWGNNAIWNSGTGWQSVSKQVTSQPGWMRQIQITTGLFTPTTVTQFKMFYDYQRGIYVNDTTAMVMIQLTRNDDTLVNHFLTESSLVNGDGQEFVWNGLETTIKKFTIWVRSSHQTGAEVYGGSCKITSIHVEGEDFNPFE